MCSVRKKIYPKKKIEKKKIQPKKKVRTGITENFFLGPNRQKKVKRCEKKENEIKLKRKINFKVKNQNNSIFNNKKIYKIFTKMC